MDQKFPRVGVGAVVLDHEGRILLQLRKKPPEANHWSIPGGRVEYMETIEDAIVRELREELGIDTRIVDLLCVTNHIVQADDAHWVSPAFLVQILDGEAANREPHSTKEIRWFSISELPPNLTVTTRSALNAYLKRNQMTK